MNLPCEDEDEDQFPHSPLSEISDAVTTPPLSPCTPFLSPDSIDSPHRLPGSPEPESLFLLTLPLPLSGYRTVSPCEIFSSLPQVEELIDVAMEPQAPLSPIVSTQPLPELLDAYSETTSPSSPDPLPSRSSSPPVAGPSRRSLLKRPRWSEDVSGDESDEFTPETPRVARFGKRTKVGSLKRAKARFEGKGTDCDLCGKHLGRATDLPRHKVSCKANPERATRTNPCEFCGKPLPGTL